MGIETQQIVFKLGQAILRKQAQRFRKILLRMLQKQYKILK